MSWLVAAAWIAPPLAFVLEVVHARRAVARKEAVAEAWLVAGARPLEALLQVRRGIRPMMVIAMMLVLSQLARRDSSQQSAVLWSLGGVAAASILASFFATLRSFVDFRLVDRVPPEAGAPFRLLPRDPPATLEVYESRPPQDGSP
jgi:hypothetical protein